MRSEAYCVVQINIIPNQQVKNQQSTTTTIPNIQQSLAVCYGSHFWFGKGKESHVYSQLLKVWVFKGIEQVFVISITQSLINCTKLMNIRLESSQKPGPEDYQLFLFFKLSYLGCNRNLLVDLLIGDISGSICSNLKGNLYQLFSFLFRDSFHPPLQWAPEPTAFLFAPRKQESEKGHV